MYGGHNGSDHLLVVLVVSHLKHNSEEISRMFSVKKVFLKFRKIHRKTLAPEPLLIKLLAWVGVL